MKFVEIYETKNNGDQSIVLVCKLENGVVVCEGDELMKRNFDAKGIPDYGSEKREMVFPKDGIRFLEQLKFHFKSGYMNASDVKDDKIN